MSMYGRLCDRAESAGCEMRLFLIPRAKDDTVFLELRCWNPKLNKYMGKAFFDPMRPDAAAQDLAEQLLILDDL